MIKRTGSCFSYFLIFLFLIFQASFQAQKKEAEPIVLSLKEAIDKALEMNWDIKIADQDVKKAEEQINEAYSNAYPKLDITGQYTRNFKLPVLFIPPDNAFNTSSETMTMEMGAKNNYSGILSLNQVIYSQKVNTAIKIASEYADFSKTGGKATRQSIILAVKKAFYGILLMKEVVKTYKQSYDVAKANYENIASMYKQGAESEYNYLRAEVQLANSQPALIQAENNLVMAQNGLKNILAVDINRPLEVKGDLVFEDIPAVAMDESGENAVSNSLLIKQLQIQESLLDKNITVEKADYYPVLSVFGQYQWQAQDNTFKWGDYKWAKTLMAGLQVNYPLFDGFRRDARVQQAVIDKEKVALSRKKLEDNIKIQVTQARLKMEEAKKRISAQEKSIMQAEKALSISQTRFKNGVGTQLELIDTQAALTAAKTNYAQALYDFLSAKADWEYAVSAE
jgi:outer membrane protein TolC